MLTLAVAAPLGVVAAVVTATTGAGGSELLPIGGYLTPAVVLLMVLHGDLASGRENKRLLKDLDAKDVIIKVEREKTEKLMNGLLDQVVPVLTTASDVIERSLQHRERDGS